MRSTTLSAALVAVLLAAPIPAFAQSTGQQGPTDKQSTAPGASGTTRAGNTDSARCEKLSGAEKAQCIRDENEKTDSRASPGSAATSGSASSGGTTRIAPDSPTESPSATSPSAK